MSDHAALSSAVERAIRSAVPDVGAVVVVFLRSPPAVSLAPDRAAAVEPARVVAAAAAVTELSVVDLRSPRQVLRYARPRAFACWALRELVAPAVPYPRIARLLNRRNHTSALAAHRKFAVRLRAGDPEAVRWADALRAALAALGG